MVSAWNNKSLTSMQNLVQISNENGFNVFSKEDLNDTPAGYLSTSLIETCKLFEKKNEILNQFLHLQEKKDNQIPSGLLDENYSIHVKQLKAYLKNIIEQLDFIKTLAKKQILSSNKIKIDAIKYHSVANSLISNSYDDCKNFDSLFKSTEELNGLLEFFSSGSLLNSDSELVRMFEKLKSSIDLVIHFTAKYNLK